MNAAQAHVGSVVPSLGYRTGFTWRCLCGAKPDSLSSWSTFDAAASALGRHVNKAEREAQR